MKFTTACFDVMFHEEALVAFIHGGQKPIALHTLTCSQTAALSWLKHLRIRIRIDLRQPLEWVLQGRLCLHKMVELLQKNPFFKRLGICIEWVEIASFHADQHSTAQLLGWWDCVCHHVLVFLQPLLDLRDVDVKLTVARSVQGQESSGAAKMPKWYYEALIKVLEVYRETIRGDILFHADTWTFYNLHDVFDQWIDFAETFVPLQDRLCFAGDDFFMWEYFGDPSLAKKEVEKCIHTYRNYVPSPVSNQGPLTNRDPIQTRRAEFERLLQEVKRCLPPEDVKRISPAWTFFEERLAVSHRFLSTRGICNI